jgi:hypothetical protein
MFAGKAGAYPIEAPFQDPALPIKFTLGRMLATDKHSSLLQNLKITTVKSVITLKPDLP